MASIKERSGSYQITVSLGRDIYGKKLIETTTFTPDPGLTQKKQQKAVEEFARQFEANIKNGIAMDGRKITLKEFTDRWFREYAPQKLQPGTVEKYKAELDEKLLPVIGHLKLSELRPATLNSTFSAMTKDGARKDGKPGGYSKATIKKTQDVLSSVLRTAVEWEIIEKNPMDKVRPALPRGDFRRFAPCESRHLPFLSARVRLERQRREPHNNAFYQKWPHPGPFSFRWSVGMRLGAYASRSQSNAIRGVPSDTYTTPARSNPALAMAPCIGRLSWCVSIRRWSMRSLAKANIAAATPCVVPSDATRCSTAYGVSLRH